MGKCVTRGKQDLCLWKVGLMASSGFFKVMDTYLEYQSLMFSLRVWLCLFCLCPEIWAQRRCLFSPMIGKYLVPSGAQLCLTAYNTLSNSVAYNTFFCFWKECLLQRISSQVLDVASASREIPCTCVLFN